MAPSQAALHELVQQAVERVLGASVAHDAILMAAGLDSLGAEELLAELSKLGRIELPGKHARSGAGVGVEPL